MQITLNNNKWVKILLNSLNYDIFQFYRISLYLNFSFSKLACDKKIIIENKYKILYNHTRWLRSGSIWWIVLKYIFYFLFNSEVQGDYSS